MGGLFKKPKMPEVRPVAPPPPAPERTADDTAALAAEQRNKFFKRGGRGGTSLTGGQGTSGGVSAISYLGGAART